MHILQVSFMVLSAISSLLQNTPLTGDMVVVFLIVLLALILFTTELVPIDLTAILIMVLLMVLEPWTHITPAEGISGFSNSATITILAMLILSSGIRRTGAVQIIGEKIAAFAGTSERKQLAATIGVAGPVSGFINNTPVVSILVPVIADLANRGKTSPSKLLIPLSYASMLGGTLTLLGTSTNILASSISGDLLNHPFSMFEFTVLGVIVLAVGAGYLLLIGYNLLPERVKPEQDLIEGYKLTPYFAEVIIPGWSPLIGKTVEEVNNLVDLEMHVLQIHRDDKRFVEPLDQKTLRENDILTLRADRRTLYDLLEKGMARLTRAAVTEEELSPITAEQRLIELVVPSGSSLVDETLRDSTFCKRYNVNVLAFRTHGEILRARIDNIEIKAGDTLLIQAIEENIDRLSQNPDFILSRSPRRPKYRTSKIPIAIGVIASVVALAALDILPLVVSALAGVVAMVVTGVLKPRELYISIDWNVIFLIAGVIPLGMALEETGAAAYVGTLVASTERFLPSIAVLWLFYVATSLITNVISNNASVVLMIPVAVSIAQKIGANPFAFVLAVTFAASMAFMTPIGYQTNLFVYGPGGYKFSDYFRAGAVLQLLLSVVTVLGITYFWGI
jgi:di/tricarboxylate transporter